MNPLAWQVCIPLAVGMRSTRKSSLDVLVPLLAFLGIYSFQPHKEWRFVIYVVPGLTAVAAIGASWIWTRRSKTIVYRFLSLALIASTVASFAVSFGMLAVSRLNYPGAVALSRVHDYGSGSRIASVHMDTLSCTTGITRFLEKAPPQSIMGGGSTLWIYDKTEDSHLLLRPSFWDRFDYVLAEKPEKVIGRWEILEVVDGFSGVGILRPGEGTNKHGELWKTSTTGSHFNMHWLWHSLEVLLRKHVTRDWWIGVKMEPKIKILRKQTGPYNITPS